MMVVRLMVVIRMTRFFDRDSCPVNVFSIRAWPPYHPWYMWVSHDLRNAWEYLATHRPIEWLTPHFAKWRS